MLSPQYIRRPLLVLASLAALLLAGVATARAEYGEVGSPINLTSSVNLKSNGLPYVFGRDPSDGSFYVGDEIEESGKLFYRIQKFSSTGTALAKVTLMANSKDADTGGTQARRNEALEGIAVDPGAKRVYVLLNSQRQFEEAEAEEVLDPEAEAGEYLYAFSTEVNNSNEELEPASAPNIKAGGVLAVLGFNSKAEKVPLFQPHGIAVDPANGDVVIVGQQDEMTVAERKAGGGAGEPEPQYRRAAVQLIASDGKLGPRYVDHTNCLGEGNGAGGEPACEAILATEQEPFSPIVSSKGRIYVELENEIWEMPAGGSLLAEPEPGLKEYEVEPKRLFTLTASELAGEQTLLQFPLSSENPAVRADGGSTALVEASATARRLYVMAGISGAPAVLTLGYEEETDGSAKEVKELGFAGGGSETAGATQCALPEFFNQGRLLAAAGENLFVFEAHVTAIEHPKGAAVFQFGPTGAGCPHSKASELTVKVKNTEGKEVEVSPIPVGSTGILAADLEGANAVSAEWKFKDLTTSQEETVTTGYQFQATGIEHKFEHPGSYEITETIQTDDLASQTLTLTKQVTVAAQPPTVQFSFPGTATVGKSAKFEASVSDPQEPGTAHLKYVWEFGDGSKHEGETTSKQFSELHVYSGEGSKSVTLKVTDGFGASGEVTHTLTVKPEEKPIEKPVEKPTEKPTEPTHTGPGGGNTPPPPTGNPEAALASTSLSVSPVGAVALKVSCPVGESSCSGTVTLRTLNAVAATMAHGGRGKRKAILTLASGSFTVAGGQAQTVTLRLSRKARALLAKAHVLHARATLVAHDPTGATHTTQTTVTLRLVVKGKSRHKH